MSHYESLWVIMSHHESYIRIFIGYPYNIYFQWRNTNRLYYPRLKLYFLMNHDESWWVTISHYESLWVMMSHTYVYSLADHIISTLTGFTTWLKSRPRFEMMEFHKKWIQNGKCYRNIYVSTYISYDFTMINIFQWRITKWLYYQPRLKS